MQNLILSIQIIIGVGLVALIMLQVRGTGVSAVFGGEGMSYQSRRGVEKLLHRGTILLAASFLVLAVINLILSK